MAAEQSAGQTGKAQAGMARLAQAVTRPGGKDVDWEKVRAVFAIIGAVTVIHGLKGRSWRYVHAAAAALAIGAVAAGHLKDKYDGPPATPENT